MSALYESLFRRALYPAYESGLRRRKTLAYLREYERNQWLSPEQIGELQWRKLAHLIEFCWEQVPFYRERWQQAGVAGPADIRNLDDYARLPVLTKQDIRDNFDTLQARSQRGAMLHKATGGSTGEPLRFGYTRESYERRTAVALRGYGWAGASLGRRTAYVWGGMGTIGNPSRRHLFKEKLYHAAFHRRMLDSYTMRDDNLVSFADEIEAFAPAVIVAYVGPIVRLAQWMIENGRTIRGVESVIGAAEALHDFQRAILEAAFPGARAYNTYGCREFMLIASECGHRDGLHVNADHLVVELLPMPGTTSDQTGELAITDIGNYGMPFMRYLNGDMATRGDASVCACGRGLPRLAQIDGRKLDAIRTSSGHILPGVYFSRLFRDIPGVRRFQVVQERLDAFRLSVVPGPGFSAEQETYIRREIAKVLGSDVALDLRLVDDIPLTASGKQRLTISELA